MILRSIIFWFVVLGGIVSLALWSGGVPTCGPFEDPHSSQYVLPYAVGSAYVVSQANCSRGGHQGPYKYSYDFIMPIGTTVTAARDGVVAGIRTNFTDGQSGQAESNWVKIRHADGTIAAYAHLTKDGALVKAGDRVVAGQPIGLSGNTGNTGGLPHMHFHLCNCAEPVDCGTLPVTFRNTDIEPNGLRTGREYRALSYAKTALR